MRLRRSARDIGEVQTVFGAVHRFFQLDWLNAWCMTRTRTQCHSEPGTLNGDHLRFDHCVIDCHVIFQHVDVVQQSQHRIGQVWLLPYVFYSGFQFRVEGQLCAPP